MVGLIDRLDKEAHVFCVMVDRSQDTLLGLVKKNVVTVGDDLDYAYTLDTRIYSDLFASYQYNAFKNGGYVLHVNHSIWFGYGLFNTNSVDGLWSQIKRLPHDFNGLTIDTINNLEEKGINEKEY